MIPLSNKSATDALISEIRFRRFHRDFWQPIFDYMELAYKERTPIFRALQNQGHSLSPYIEIGAETGANALALTNALDADGAACDISPDSLDAIGTYAKKMDLKKLPLCVVMDAHRLPFRSNSLPFVLAWGALHHFADPKAVLKEIRRVLHPDGIFYFDGEPVYRKLSANLWTTGAMIHMGRIQNWLLHTGILHWVAQIDGAEAIRAGVIEAKPTLESWESMLSIFDEVKWTYSAFTTGTVPSAGTFMRRVAARLSNSQNPERTIVRWFGGAVGGVCHLKDAAESILPAKRIEDALACPDCVNADKDAPLTQSAPNEWACGHCHKVFAANNNALVLLPESLHRKLPI